MADILKLKKKAADFEAKKQMDKALATYREMIEVYESGEEDPIDIPLYNRVGDLLQKAGNLSEAVSVWERAVDHYTEGGFYNPAIALCNKILRQSPGRAVVYYKLGKISAEKGFKADARQNFLEYASRMQKAGNLNEAFRALKEFADLVPDQDDVRVMLADQLVKADRKDEAIEQLQIAYAQRLADGREDDAQDLVTKMKAIDPAVEPNAEATTSSSKGGDLVFLDLGGPPNRPTRGATPGDARRVSKLVQGLELLDLGTEGAAPTKPAAKPAAQPAPPAKAAPTAAPAAPPAARPSVPTPGPSKAAPPRPSVPTPGPTRTPPTRPSAPTPGPSTVVPGRPGTPRATVPVAKKAPEPPPAPPTDDLLIEPTNIGDAPPPARGSVLGLETTVFPQEFEPPPEPASFIELEPSFGTPAAANDDPPAIELVEMIGVDGAPDLPLLEDTAGFGEASPERPLDAADLTEQVLEEESGTPAPGEPPPETMYLDMEVSDFSTFGTAEPATDPSSLPAGFDLLELEAPATIEPFSEPSEIEEASPVGQVDVEPPAPRETSTVLAISVDSLRDQLTDDPENAGLRRQYAEALLDDGQREEGIAELELALAAYERDADLDTAASIAEEIVRLAPTVIKYHQKRVEFAFRANDRRRLAEAYVELADALLADGQGPKARVVYQRVLEIAPDDLRAQAALETIVDAPVPEPAPAPRRSTTAVKPTSAPKPAPKKPKKQDDEDFISLGDWLREEDEPKSTRMVVEEKEPTGDEQADFNDMLRKFKQGVADNVDEEDHEAHYDLGIAYKEMGLIDEAIGEFQIALRGTNNRARAYEALGHCFVEKGQLPVASTILQRALGEPGVGDEALVGVLYLLGAIAEELQLFADAKRYYQRVFAVDIRFRDVGDRLNTVEQRLK